MLDLTSYFTTKKNSHSDVLLGSRSKFISLSTRLLSHSTAHSAHFQRMAQPNFQILANAARASAHELELIPNPPAVNLEEQVLQMQQILREMQETQRQLDQLFQHHRQQLDQLFQHHGQPLEQLARQGEQHGQRLAELHQVITRS
jgi:hypothetical protein